MPKRSDLTAAQRQEAVLDLLRRAEPAARLARRFGVSEQTLYRWRETFLPDGEAALASGQNGKDTRDREVQELSAQVEEHDQVIGELTVVNRMLENSRASPVESGEARGGTTGVGGQPEGTADTGSPGHGDRDQ